MESPSTTARSLLKGMDDDGVQFANESIEHDSGDDSSDDTRSRSHHSGLIDSMVFDEPSRPLSPDTSPQRSDDEVSVLLSDYRGPSHSSSQPVREESLFTPMRPRFAFRNSSYVRTMQNNDTTPPHYHMGSPATSQQRLHRFPTPSRNSTPRSVRSSHSGRNSISPSKKLKKEHPLVLLHVTILPIPYPYSVAVMERVLPPHILSNWKILQDKATATVLERGILIPHPREDYETLEERLLESLELALPRILKCGHFHLSEEESQAILEAGEDTDAEEDGSKDFDICPDCNHRIRDGRYGMGAGNRRWDVKVYAANGLMRSGAWSAAWREMERVDVEIMPWLGEELRRELEIAKEEEAALLVEQRQQQEELGPRSETRMDEERMREIYGGDPPQDCVDGLQGEQVRNAPSPLATSTFHERREIPLTRLLKDYILNMTQDPRNIAIGVLSLLIVFMAMLAVRSSRQVLTTSPDEVISSVQHTALCQASIASQLPPASSPAPLPKPAVPDVPLDASKKAVLLQESREAREPEASQTDTFPEQLVRDGKHEESLKRTKPLVQQQDTRAPALEDNIEEFFEHSG